MKVPHPKKRTKFKAHRSLKQRWLTKNVVGAGGVERDVDGGDVVVVVPDVAAPHVPRPREVAPNNVLVTLVSSLRTLVWNEQHDKFERDEFLLIGHDSGVSYTRAGLVDD